MRFGLPRNSRRIQRLGSQSNSTTTEEIRIATTHNDKTRHSELIQNKETCRDSVRNETQRNTTRLRVHRNFQKQNENRNAKELIQKRNDLERNEIQRTRTRFGAQINSKKQQEIRIAKKRIETHRFVVQRNSKTIGDSWSAWKSKETT